MWDRNVVKYLKQEARTARRDQVFEGVKCKEHLMIIMDYLDTLQYQDRVDYDYIYKIIILGAQSAGEDLDKPYDWEAGDDPTQTQTGEERPRIIKLKKKPVRRVPRTRKAPSAASPSKAKVGEEKKAPRVAQRKSTMGSVASVQSDVVDRKIPSRSDLVEKKPTRRVQVKGQRGKARRGKTSDTASGTSSGLSGPLDASREKRRQRRRKKVQSSSSDSDSNRSEAGKDEKQSVRVPEDPVLPHIAQAEGQDQISDHEERDEKDLARNGERIEHESRTYKKEKRYENNIDVRKQKTRVFEFSKYLIIFFLIALKLISYKNYRSLIELKGFSRLRRLTRNTRYEDELYYVWCAFCVVYFLLVSLTLIRNIMDYEMKARIEHGRDHEYHPAMVHPLQRRRRLVPREPEVVGNENIDDPPPYSSTIRAGSTVETAKEETDPPRYSQIELPLDRTRSLKVCLTKTRRFLRATAFSQNGGKKKRELNRPLLERREIHWKLPESLVWVRQGKVLAEMVCACGEDVVCGEDAKNIKN
ncbi:unnamed protein product [Nippostrongylus brasiliensis]|uniref:PKD_channel domain-containing protein n=1 Tax=Nippostrongylus brasiliensis TaxID=27835 RepID=A0A158QXF4_NIPBR|nr:unnamed protein product [Nippostrongylus brasiliensis]